MPHATRSAALEIADGKIVRVGEYDESGRRVTASAERDGVIDFGDLVISPGVVDTHVHVNEPGRTEWEGCDTATRAAAAGGVTTIVDMPLNSIPATTTVAALEEKRAAARGRCHVDVAFWGGVVPGNANELDALIDAGARGFKCFLVPSGVDEFPAVGERDLREALPTLARRGVPLLVHAEDPRIIAECGTRNAERGRAAAIADAGSKSDARALGPREESRTGGGCERYQTYLATRPAAAEVEAIRLMIRLSREFGAHVHIVHVSSADGVDEIARAKREGVRVTAETCPHYLTFVAGEIADRATEFKCAPPIRDCTDRDALWAALEAGVLDLVATDHSPSPPSLKESGDFLRAWGGIASLELSLSAVWTAAAARLKPSRYEDETSQPSRDDDTNAAVPARACDTDTQDVARRLQPSDLARWLSAAPARLAGLDDRKGRIAVGCDADLVVWDPDAERTVTAADLQQRHKLTPYAGRTLRGVVRTTFVRGERVWDDGRLVLAAAGQLL